MANMSSMSNTPEASRATTGTTQDSRATIGSTSTGMAMKKSLSGAVIAPEGTFQHRAQHLIKSQVFEWCMGSIIILNVVSIVIETDQIADEGDPDAWLVVASWSVLGVFIFELLLRLFAMGWHFWQDMWNVFDFIIVTLDTSLSVLGVIVGTLVPISVLRMFRLTKMTRITRLVRVFPELRVLARSLAGATRAQGWGLVLLFFILLVWSILAVIFIYPLAKDLNIDDECPRCRRAYASVFDAMLTFFQSLVVAEGWGPGPVLLIETYPSTILFFVPMFGLVGMAVLNLILGVVVDVSMSAKVQLEQEDEKAMKIKRMREKVDLVNMLESIDESGNGYVTKDGAFRLFAQPGQFRDSLLALQITDEDFEMIWTIVDHDKMDHVPYREFIDRVYAIRVSDPSFLLTYIKYYITLIRNDVKKSIRLVEAKVDAEKVQLQKMENIEISMEREMEKMEVNMHNLESSLDVGSMPVERPVLNKGKILEGQKVKFELRDASKLEPSEAWISSQKVLEQCILNLQTELQKARDSQMESKQFNGLKFENALQDIQGELKRSHESQMELKKICTGFSMESALQDVLDMRSEVKLSLDGVEANHKKLDQSMVLLEKQNGLLAVLKDLTESYQANMDAIRDASPRYQSVDSTPRAFQHIQRSNGGMCCVQRER